MPSLKVLKSLNIWIEIFSNLKLNKTLKNIPAKTDIHNKRSLCNKYVLLYSSNQVSGFCVTDKNLLLEFVEEPGHEGTMPLEYLVQNSYSQKSREAHSRTRNVEVYEASFNN